MKHQILLSSSRIAMLLCMLLSIMPVYGANTRGDANNDGVANITDVTTLINYLLHDGEGTSYYSVSYADMDRDGKITISDVTSLINYLLMHSASSDAPTRTFTINGVKFTMVRVEAGTFTMGCDTVVLSGYFNPLSPEHQVTLTKDYYIGQTEVTQELWKAVMGSADCAYANPLHPMNMIGYSECERFCNTLSELTGIEFRLPTEAEWEFAARGGNKSRGYRYSGSDNLDEVAWYRDNTDSYMLCPVATKAPNELGLYDMSGNAWEIVADHFYIYSSDPVIDPLHLEYDSQRDVIRGGSTASHATECYPCYRSTLTMGSWGALTTMRLAFTAY